MIKIDKNVPMPAARITQRKYPWREMAVGDSIAIPNLDTARYAYRVGAQLNRKYSTRREGSGYRIWRTK